MPSVGAALVAAAAVGFGAPVAVRVTGAAPALAPGATVGEFLVAAAPAPDGDGGTVVVLRPLALGTLAVPLPGAPEPAQVDVTSTLAPGAAPAPVVVPAAPAPGWTAGAAIVATLAVAGLATWALARRRAADPFARLEEDLQPLARASSWRDAEAADALARHCRVFLARVTGAPCAAMTTRELSRLLAARLEAATARPFGLALVLADEVRYTRSPAPADDAALLVRDVLRVAPLLGQRRGGAR